MPREYPVEEFDSFFLSSLVVSLSFGDYVCTLLSYNMDLIDLDSSRVVLGCWEIDVDDGSINSWNGLSDKPVSYHKYSTAMIATAIDSINVLSFV